MPHSLYLVKDRLLLTVSEPKTPPDGDALGYDSISTSRDHVGLGLTPGAVGRAFGGAREDRTPDLLRARQALSQLSYGPEVWWVWVDLNHRPHPYQGCALTN